MLDDVAQTAGDEWLAPLLSGVSSEAIAAGLINLGDVVLLDPQSMEGEEGEEIVITGRGYKGRSYAWDGGDGGDGSGSGGTGSTGGGGSYAVPVAQHTQDYGTEDGAAAQVAKHVKGELPTGVSGPVDPVTTPTGNDRMKVEFGALIVKNPDGTFGALNDTIYSQDLNDRVTMVYNTPQPIQGFWHSHPAAGSGEIDKAKGRYPSASDWITLANIAGAAGAASNPSIWLMDYDGTTREFKLDERGYFESLDDAQKGKGDGLAGRERTQSCG